MWLFLPLSSPSIADQNPLSTQIEHGEVKNNNPFGLHRCSIDETERRGLEKKQQEEEEEEEEKEEEVEEEDGLKHT